MANDRGASPTVARRLAFEATPEAPVSAMPSRPVTVAGPSTAFANLVTVGPHQLRADEPVASEGTDTGPSPFELLLSALGACTSMTISVYARRKGWPLESVSVTLTHHKIPASECTDCRTTTGEVDEIRRHITLVGALSDEQRARLLDIANKCPVHKTLTGEIKVRSDLV